MRAHLLTAKPRQQRSNLTPSARASGWEVRRSKDNHKKEVFRAPGGKVFLSRQAVLDHALKEGNVEDVEKIERGMEKKVSRQSFIILYQYGR